METFLWVEKYRPRSISECILPEDLKNTFSEFVKDKHIPNLILCGSAGVGKTTVAKVLAETHQLDMMFMNASTERGIDDVRMKIDSFASTTSLMGGYKVLLLDEADNLTQDAQKALRALIEQYQNNCRFVLTCNFPYKLIDPLRSRLQEYNFTYPANGKTIQNSFIKRILSILSQEKVQLKKEDVPVLQSLVGMYYPNWRRCIHELQRITSSGSIDPVLVNKIKEQHISTLFELMSVKNFTKVREWVAENMAQGVSETQVISLIYKEMKEHLKPQSQPQAVLILADYQAKAAVVSNQEINTVGMCVELMMECEFS